MHIENIKEEAHRLLDSLPDSATWDDIMYRIKKDQIDVVAVIHGARLS